MINKQINQNSQFYQDIKIVVLTHRLDVNEGLATLHAAGVENSPPDLVKCRREQDRQQL